MARMFPERLSESVSSAAERRLFDVLRDDLDGRYTVFSGVRWLKKKRGGSYAGEADMVIIDPQRGMIVLEVKGGGISHDAVSGSWFSHDRYGEQHSIKNPAEQAQRNFYDLCDKLQEVDVRIDLRKAGGHAVAFPDSAVRTGDLGLDLPREIIIDSDDLSDIGSAVDRVFNFVVGSSARQLTSAEMQTITNVLARSWQITPSLKEAMRREGSQFVELTESQFRLLDFMAGQHRALIAGCAGSGKTFLAAEKARRLADQGFDVLLTCFNKNLAAWLRESMAPVSDNLRIQHFHELAYEMCGEAGIEVRVPGTGDRPEFFRETLPELLLDAVDHLTDRFDAIIVDEGQDFHEEWWVPLQALLRDPDNGVWYIFYDDQQSIYTTGAAPPFEGTPYQLNTNMRSTKAIHEHVKRFYDSPVDCLGPEGRSPTVVKTADVEQHVRSTLHRLVVEEKLSPADIVMLTPASPRRSRWREGQRIGNLTLTWSPHPERMEIPVSTIHSFKGLESPVVIVTEMEAISDYQPEDRLRLVAYSRARNELIVIEQSS